MAAQKGKKYFQLKSFCAFKCLLTQNPSNQSSQLFKTKSKTITKSKKGGFSL